MSKDKKIPNFWDYGPMVVTGCTQCSDGCDHCWSMKAHAMRMNNPAVSHIYSPELMTDGKFNGKVQFNLRLLEDAIKRAKPGEVIAIWNDLYHEGVKFKEYTDAHDIMGNAEHLTFLIVTKRPESAILIKDIYPTPKPWPSHIWHIVTCENQAMADKRIPHLLKIPGKRGIIIEPMLGPIDKLILNVCGGSKDLSGCEDGCEGCLTPQSKLNQVICGPENGPGKRPFDPAWADSVKAQCEAAGVPFYRKDTGEGVLAWRT